MEVRSPGLHVLPIRSRRPCRCLFVGMAEWHVYATDARDGDELINGNEVAATDTGGNLPRQVLTASGSI
jgi:hypothetical protein